ncbi:hypothetical protein GGF43_003882, partial [Coemansia sp. RSA 2618]
MGNAVGKLNGSTICDGGSLSPNGIYAVEAQDFDAKVVYRLITARQLGPFYEGSDDADPDPDQDPNASTDDAGGWWSYNLMLAQQQQQQQTAGQDNSSESSSAQHSREHSVASSREQSVASLREQPPDGRRGHGRKGSGLFQRLRAHHTTGAQGS